MLTHIWMIHPKKTTLDCFTKHAKCMTLSILVTILPRQKVWHLSFQSKTGVLHQCFSVHEEPLDVHLQLNNNLIVFHIFYTIKFRSKRIQYFDTFLLKCFRYQIVLPNSYSETSTAPMNNKNQWFHIIFNFIGPSAGQGFRVYHDGELVINATRILTGITASMDRRIVIGRFYTDVDDKYSSLEMDELLFFKKVLTGAEIRMLRPRA